MNREEERLIWACALDLFAVPVLQGFVLRSVEYIQRDMRDCDIPRLASPEGMSEVAGHLLEDIKQGRRALLHDFRSFNREHLRALKDIRIAIASEILRRVPDDELTPRLPEIKFRVDLGL
ncbi:hypothetical protein [Phytopseudomonas seleniipraecipitans]|uniref:Uncharacterized protein n=1 Tax=Phytopseudomonas seleniipraecipitans TaxID=640205 RepID=A0A1G7RQI6_9GAMM|nr:hypothetical protein [Pseudomonas seleniipraecipitans]SDG13038.1 hypothetical protein SAMN05216381_3235 [Pseudomonas seleniipraecipitans]